METEQCQVLREYRENILRLPQAEVARRAKCNPAWISFIERGHLPRPWNREHLLKAYELNEAEFVRMVQNARKTKTAVRELKEPMSKTHPLLATATAEHRAQIDQIPENHPDCLHARKIAQ